MKRLMLAGLCLSLGACMTVGPDYELPKEAAIQRTDLNGPLRQDADSVVSHRCRRIGGSCITTRG